MIILIRYKKSIVNYNSSILQIVHYSSRYPVSRKSEGGYLATITSKDEQNFVFEKLLGADAEVVWEQGRNMTMELATEYALEEPYDG